MQGGTPPGQVGAAGVGRGWSWQVWIRRNLLGRDSAPYHVYTEATKTVMEAALAAGTGTSVAERVQLLVEQQMLQTPVDFEYRVSFHNNDLSSVKEVYEEAVCCGENVVFVCLVATARPPHEFNTRATYLRPRIRNGRRACRVRLQA